MTDEETKIYVDRIKAMDYTEGVEYKVGVCGGPKFYSLGVKNTFDKKVVKIPQYHQDIDGDKNRIRLVDCSRGAFKNNLYITDIILPERFSFGDYMLKNCKNLERITISKRVKGIGYGCFSGCEKLSDIIYEGTKEDWEKIKIFDTVSEIKGVGKGAKFTEIKTHISGNEILKNVTVHYNCDYLTSKDKY